MYNAQYLCELRSPPFIGTGVLDFIRVDSIKSNLYRLSFLVVFRIAMVELLEFLAES
jgi:hypothetical protein